MGRYENEEMAWQRVLDVQREAENRRLLNAGGSPATSGLAGLAGVIADVTWSFVHAFGLAPRWWAGDSAAPKPQGASEETPAPHQAPHRSLAPRG
jgi:hypothetical protein